MKKSLIALAISSVLLPQVNFAQEDGFLEEVTVTAQRREQSLQDVPIAVTAFSGADIEKLNIVGATDYLNLTPNVSYTEDGQAGSRGLGISIRGINNLVSGENAFINSVGIYLDEFSVASVPNQVANPLLPDIERVEVLRGPQGTYFGRNSLGGALNLTTKAPTDEFEGSVQIGGESYNNAGEMFNFTGVLNLPVSDSFRMRGVLFYEDSSGLVENIQPGATPDSGHEYLMFRLRSELDLGENTTARLTFIYSDEEQGTDENVPSGVLDLDTVDTFGIASGRAFDPGTGFWPDNRNELSHDLRESNELDTIVAVLNIEHQLNDSIVLKSITGIIDAEQERLFDNDTFGGADLIFRDNRYTGTSWSTELRLEATNENFDWVVGAMYASDDQEQDNNVAISTNPTASIDGVGFLPPFPQGLGLALNNKNFEVDSFAIFADFNFRLNEKLDLTVGARYTDDEVTNEVTSFGIAPGPGADVDFFGSFINVPRPTASGKRSFSDFSPRVTATYQATENVNLYATISKGYKAGGTSVGNNTNADGSPAFTREFDEEELWNYEIGFKAELADRRVRFNGSAFYLKWSDLQLEAFRFLTPGDLSSNFEQAINVDDAEAAGAEFELLVAPNANLTFGGSLGYLDTEITSNSTAEITGGFVVNLQGLEIPKAPELTANIFGEYAWPVGQNEAWVRLEYIHRDSQYSDVEGLTNRQTRGPSPNQGLVRVLDPSSEFPYLSPEIDIFNLRAGFDMERTSINFYIQNLTDEEYYTGTQENFGLSGIRLRPHPMVFGASVSFKF